MSHRNRIRATLFLLVAAGAPGPVVGQEPSSGWNDPRSLELVERGVERRMTEVVDSALRTYSAEARGYVYFLLDAPELDRQTLVRTDQVALDIYWRTPNEVRQRIVGMRQERELPVARLHYYLDRLTVVQDNYDEGIVIADGDNVNDVPHPVSRGARDFYDYRLVDSLTVRLPGAPEPVTVHELQVRPRDASVPAVIGSVFLEGNSGALVRMSFTFTPSAYVDPRLDFINVTLENGLWGGRYWLPYEQRLEIRREMPELDLPFGTVIRTRMRIGDYTFNEAVPEWLFASPCPVTMAPRAQRESYAFEQPIDAEWRLEGIDTPLSVEEVRREARVMLGDQAVSGLARARFGAAALSDLVRYNRAEGPALAIGAGLRPLPGVSARVRGGWAFGARHPLLSTNITLESPESGHLHELNGYLNRPMDVGGWTPTPGVFNSLSSLLFGQDWLDPYYASGLTGSLRIELAPQLSLTGTAGFERQRSARLTSTYSLSGSDDLSRPVREIDAGHELALGVALDRAVDSAAGGWWARASLFGGRLWNVTENLDFAQLGADAGWTATRSQRRARVDLTGSVGTSVGTIPRQRLYLLGGPGALPGYDTRSFAGDQYLLVTGSTSADVWHPWVRGRLFAGIGSTAASDAAGRALNAWGGQSSGGLKPMIGAGVGLFYDILHLEMARGLASGGRGQILIGVQRTFWDFL